MGVHSSSEVEVALTVIGTLGSRARIRAEIDLYEAAIATVTKFLKERLPAQPITADVALGAVSSVEWSVSNRGD